QRMAVGLADIRQEDRFVFSHVEFRPSSLSVGQAVPAGASLAGRCSGFAFFRRFNQTIQDVSQIGANRPSVRHGLTYETIFVSSACAFSRAATSSTCSIDMFL